VFGGEDLPHREMRLSAKVVGLTDPSTGTTCEFPNGRTEATREDSVVEGPSLRVIGGDARRRIV
jgi:hypothetical protein